MEFEATSLDTPRDFALAYAQLGFRVLPVGKRSKKPTEKGWPNRASNSVDVVAKKAFPNVGIAAGKGSGIVVLDVDPRNGGEHSLATLETLLGTLPTTVKARSGGGGYHYLFRHCKEAKTVKRIPGLDVLSDGAFFVATPSVHPETGAFYEWENSPFENEIAELPQPWREELFSATKASRVIELEGEIAEGHRNEQLFLIATQLRKEEKLTKRQLEIRLLETNLLQCSPPLPEEEVVRIALQVANYESNKSVKTQYQEAVMASDLPKVTKLLLIAQSLYANADGTSCYPNIEDLAAQAGCTRKTAGEHLERAHEAGWFKRYRHSRTSAGPGYSYGYVLSPPIPDNV